MKGNEYRCKEHSSLSVRSDRLTWYWHSKGIGGYGALDFLMKVEGVGFCEAMGYLTNIDRKQPQNLNDNDIKTLKSLVMPEKSKLLFKRLYAYLNKTHGIDSNIITTLIQEKKLYEDTRGNIVFIGYDEHNTPKFACLRGTYTDNSFRMDCTGSDKQYGFAMNHSNKGRLYIFEAPIDCMSHATLENLITDDKNAWLNDNRLSLGGTSDLALGKYLEFNESVTELIFCLDNDKFGREASVKMARKYSDLGYYTRLELPKNKDYNEDLLEYRAKSDELIAPARKLLRVY